MDLAHLANTHRPRRQSRRVGRGVGCKKGKTCGRGAKGDKARSGYKRHAGREGGQLPLYRKLPTRGFPRGRFYKESLALNLSMIERLYRDGETVNFASLREKGLAARELPGGIKILGYGELKRKVTIEAHRFSESAKEKLTQQGIPFKELSLV